MLPSKGQFTLRRLTPTNRNRHFVKFYQIGVLPMLVSDGVGACFCQLNILNPHLSGRGGMASK